MADKEKPMILSFNTVWVVVVFIFSLGLLHANVTNGVKDNTDGINNLKVSFQADSRKAYLEMKEIYLEIKELNKSQQEANEKDIQFKNDIEWIRKGQDEIKDLIKNIK